MYQPSDRNTDFCVVDWYLGFDYYQWVDASAGRLVVPKDMTHTELSVSALTWFIEYLYY
jgi:hypothetical protein